MAQGNRSQADIVSDDHVLCGTDGEDREVCPIRSLDEPMMGARLPDPHLRGVGEIPHLDTEMSRDPFGLPTNRTCIGVHEYRRSRDPVNN